MIPHLSLTYYCNINNVCVTFRVKYYFKKLSSFVPISYLQNCFEVRKIFLCEKSGKFDNNFGLYRSLKHP